jgi:hypothetical protein
MGIVADYLRNLIARQVDEHHLVVWFDPERHYAEFSQTLALPGTTIVCYEGSFFALRHTVESLIGGDEPPRLLVYVPLSEEETQQALIELTATATVLKPGQGAPQRNTRLSVVARRALKETLGPEKAEDLARQVDAGKLALADLDRLNEQQGGSAVIATIFGAGSPQDVALLFLSSPRFDEKIAARNAVAEVAQVLGRAFGLALVADASCAELRASLARHTITAEFIASLRPPLPAELTSVPVPSDPAILQACVTLARTWRLRRDLQENYATYADQAEVALGLATIAFTLAEIPDCETFAGVETALQAAVEEALLNAPDPALLDLAQARQTSFWSEQRPAIRARWALAHTAGLLLQEALRIERELKQAPAQPEALLRAYAEGAQPWCLLDTYQRNLERRWHTFELSDGAAYRTLENLVTCARQRFMDVGDTLAERFVRALAGAKFAIPGVLRQRDTYATIVRPAIKAAKTAYVLVDALRFEMARELLPSFADEYESQLSVALGTVPSITEIGMAALLPGADGTVAVVPAGEGKLGLKIGDIVLKDRRSRLDWFAQQISGSIVITTLEEMLPKPKQALHSQLQAADVILVTSQEIDELAERDNIRLARKVMDDVLPDLARLVRKLREYGCQTIVLTADHGYLFGDELESDMKIDPPGGQTVDLKRRVWVGRGGSDEPAFLRTSLAQFGLSNTLEMAVPWGFGVFKAQGGARAYFHGGMSPQELAVPVLVLTPVTTSRVMPLANIAWSLQTGSKKLSTRFFSVQIAGRSTGLFELEPPRVRIEIRSKGEVISEPVSATYGLIGATNEVELKVQEGDRQSIEPNTVTLMISRTPAKTVTVHLLDATTGRELERVEKIEVALLAF